MFSECREIERAIDPNWALYVLVFNVVMPGFGTLVSAYKHKEGCSGLAVVAAFFQSILSAILIGWVWSVYSGWRIYKLSTEEKGPNEEPILDEERKEAAKVE